MRLDHLLSKESTARASRETSSSGSSYVDHWLVGPPAIPTPRRLRARVAPPGAVGVRTSLFRFEGARDHPGLRAGGEQSVHPGQRGAVAHASTVTVARDLCPLFGGARSHPLVENCRASTSIKNEETPKLQRANGGCLGARCR